MIQGIGIKEIYEVDYKSHLTLDEMEELSEERKRMDDEIRQTEENNYNDFVDYMNAKSHNYSLTLGEEVLCQMGGNFDKKG